MRPTSLNNPKGGLSINPPGTPQKGLSKPGGWGGVPFEKTGSDFIQLCFSFFFVFAFV